MHVCATTAVREGPRILSFGGTDTDPYAGSGTGSLDDTPHGGGRGVAAEVAGGWQPMRGSTSALQTLLAGQW